MVSTAPGLESGLRILELVADNGSMGFNQLKAELELSPASLNRYVKTLVDRDFLEKNENQQYTLGRKMREIPGKSDNSEALAAIVQPVLENVAESFHHTAQFIRFNRGRMVCSAKHMVQEGLTMQKVGEERTDYVIHPWGFLFLASLDEKTRRHFIDNANVSHHFRPFIPEEEFLASYIRDAARNGFSDDKGRILPNVRRIAFPVFSGRSGGKLLGAIAAGVMTGLSDDADFENIIRILKDKSEALCNIL